MTATRDARDGVSHPARDPHDESCPEESPRERLLARLKGKSTYRYGRYGGLPLRYGGGKSLAVGHVIEQLPAGLTRLVSPFVGGASVEIACANELGMEVTAYDVFDILTGYWQVQLDAPEELAERIGRWQPTKETYASVKQRLKAHWDRTEPIEDPLELAAHYWFNHNLSYGPGFLGWMSRIYEEPARYERLLDKVRTFRCPGMSVAQGDFADVLPRHRDDFLYCDPPYYLDGDSRMFRGIYPQRNFPVHHRGFDHGLLRDLLAEHRGGFVLSYNDCSAVRQMYSDCRVFEVEWQYTLGQGETRIGKNRVDRGTITNVKRSHELLIIAEAEASDD